MGVGRHVDVGKNSGGIGIWWKGVGMVQQQTGNKLQPLLQN